MEASEGSGSKRFHVSTDNDAGLKRPLVGRNKANKLLKQAGSN